jgi:hypothetical protein
MPAGRIVCWVAGFAALLAAPFEVVAQQTQNPIVALGNAAVTGFSGALPPIQIGPGSDPGAKTFIDLNGPSLRVIDLQHMGGLPQAQFVGAPKPFTFSAASLGQVFGVALDDSAPPNIYAAATSAYGLPIVAPGPDGQLQHIKRGAPNAIYMPGLWGPKGGPGSIWKIEGATGKVSLFANVTLDGRSNSGPALGGLAYDAQSKSLFVADRETGFIHRFGLDGRDLGHYDHGVVGRAAQGLPPVQWNPEQRIDPKAAQFDSTDPATWSYAPPQRRVFGLAVHQHRLYYAIADGLQVWSVGLHSDGSFGGDAVIELAAPPSTGPTEISKIAFDEQGRMFLAERPAPTGAFDFEAVAVPAIGRVLRYAIAGTTADGRRLWQPEPDEYAIGFSQTLRNGNGGVAIGYRYDAKGNLASAFCGGFMWSTGENLRDAAVPALAAKLTQSGPLDVDGLQGNETWRIRRGDEPPFASYFIDYDDKFEENAARGHMGDIAIPLACSAPPPPQIQIFPTTPGGPPGRLPGRPGIPGTPGTPGTPGAPPGGTNPPSCPPNQTRNVTTGTCGQCSSPGVLINGKCCSVDALLANPACSNSSCPSGQTPIGPSNFCCNSNQVYSGSGGAPACCSGQVVNGQCQSTNPPPPACAPGSPSCCGSGYVAVGGSCCLATQMTSTGTCCPSGQVPSGANKSQCKPPIFIPIGPRCCSSGLVPSTDGKCCAAANMTSTGVCCSQAVNANDRTKCPVPAAGTPVCGKGYTRMRDGTCCNNRYISDDGMSCITNPSPCPKGQFRDSSGACSPVVPPCPAGEALDASGNCVGGGAGPPPPPLTGRSGRHPGHPPRGGSRNPPRGAVMVPRGPHPRGPAGGFRGNR